MSKITITLEQLCELGACEEGITAFLYVFPEGIAEIDPTSHEDAAKVLSGPLAEFVYWAVNKGVFGGFRLTVGDNSTATVGDNSKATAGVGGTATAGYYGTAKAGEYGTATAGVGGTAAAGDYGEIRIRWHDGARYRLAVGYVGEDGIKPDTLYRVVNGKLTEVEL